MLHAKQHKHANYNFGLKEVIWAMLSSNTKICNYIQELFAVFQNILASTTYW